MSLENVATARGEDGQPLEGYAFHLVNIECMPGSSRFNVVMELEEPVEDLLPYLASIVPGCTYIHGSGTLQYMESGHIVSFAGRRATITDVGDREEGARWCRRCFELIRKSKHERPRLVPVHEKRPTVTVLDIFRALPGTNCGRCRRPTCLAFAAEVFRREASIGQCPPLMEQEQAGGAVIEKLRANGYPVP